MNILITGTDGFIGKNLKGHLQAKGHRIFGTVYYQSPGTNEIRLDLSRNDDLARLPAIRFDAVIHAAGSIDQNLGHSLLMKINAEGTKRIVEWAKKNGCRHFVHLSSVSVYGPKTLGQNRREDNTKRYEGIFALPYMRSKASAERYVEKSGLPHTILRLPPVMGASDSYFSPAVIEPLKKDLFFFSGKGNKLVSLIYVKNLCMITEKLIHTGPLNDIFNCSDYHIPWTDIVREYSRLLGTEVPDRKKSILSIATRFSDKKYLLMITFSFFGAHYPSEKLAARIGPLPFLPWQDGIMEAVNSYR